MLVAAFDLFVFILKMIRVHLLYAVDDEEGWDSNGWVWLP